MSLTTQACGLSFIGMTDRFNFSSTKSLYDTPLGELLARLQQPGNVVDCGACRQLDKLVGDRTAQSTIGSLIYQLTDVVNSGHGQVPVRLADGSGRYLTGIMCSYRGVYEDLCLIAAPPRPEESELNAEQVLANLKEMLGVTYVGYKGGNYVMTEETYVWVGAYGTTVDSARIVSAAYDYETRAVQMRTVPDDTELVVPYSGLDADERVVEIFKEVVRITWDAAINSAQSSVRDGWGVPKAAQPFAKRVRQRLERLKSTMGEQDATHDFDGMVDGARQITDGVPLATSNGQTE